MVNGYKPVIAIFGGSFDPPHRGHQQIVKEALKLLRIDRLIVLPAYLNPFKTSSHASATQRLEWCRQLFDPIPKVTVDPYEIEQAKSVPTIRSLEHFSTMYRVKYLIIGSDNLSTLTKWQAFERLNEQVTWVIATRKGHPLKTDMLRSWVRLDIQVDISSTDIREAHAFENVDTRIMTTVKQTLKGKQTMTMEERINRIVSVLDEKKAEEIEVFNLEGADYIADRVVIANSLNLKHTQALYDQLKDALKPKGEQFLHADMSDEWIVADLGDILIHIMIPEYRQKYSLETFLSELVENQKKADR